MRMEKKTVGQKAECIPEVHVLGASDVYAARVKLLGLGLLDVGDNLDNLSGSDLNPQKNKRRMAVIDSSCVVVSQRSGVTPTARPVKRSLSTFF